MKFTRTELEGVWLLDLETVDDDRGFFARTWCGQEFRQRGLSAQLAQCNLSYNRRRGTLRGLHYQAPPHEEAKLVRVTRGAIFDVAVDVRPHSQTALQWLSVELTADNRRSLYVAEGFAHGFQTLTDDTEVLYQMSTAYHPDSARGIRWNDPAL
ncbi:MAG: dTDP-4-dehydrorhamnose 3,5-epimerase, partial [Gammaproteobacteria bacterium]|nr:dTDP-4-dehydrorhamnose 3,5-epimerase [Gammaproteobacteria bacterium]